MIVPDVNLLLYAEIDAHPLHRAARRSAHGEFVIRALLSCRITNCNLESTKRRRVTERVYEPPTEVTATKARSRPASTGSDESAQADFALL